MSERVERNVRLRSPGFVGGVALAVIAAVGCGTSTPAKPGTDASRDGAADGGAGRGSGGGAGSTAPGTGGRAAGGTSGTGGGAAAGGLGTGGAATGGAATGGAAAGGAGTGGAATGGAATGGAATGGAATGGAATGGAATGGAATGGAATGGAATGGAATGGAATGGAATGGAATGGAATGGAATGGAGAICTPGTWSVDQVPSAPNPPTVGTLPTNADFFLDNSGHLHLVRYYDLPNTTLGSKRYWLHLIRPPGAQWTSGTILYQGSTASTGGSGTFVDTAYLAYAIGMTSAGSGSLLGETQTGSIGDDWFHPPPLRSTLFSTGFRGDRGRFVVKNNTNGVLSAADGTLAGSTLGAAYTTLPFTGVEPQADIDDLGTSHVAYLNFTTRGPMYASKTTAGTWTTPESTPGGVLVVTPGGVPHLLRVTAGGVIESHRTSTGWVDQVVDAAGIAAQHGADKLDRLHVAYATSTQLRYARIAADGTLATETVTGTSASGQVRIDQAGTVRIFAGTNIYSRCAAASDAFAAQSGVWSTLTEFPNAPLPGIEPERWAYDAARGRAVLYSGRTVTQYGRLPLTMEWDTATKTWATGGPMLSTSPFTQGARIDAAAFDWNSGKIVGVGADNGVAKTFRWDGAPTGWTVIGDQSVGSIAFVGYDGPSSTFIGVASGTLLRWTGTTWESMNAGIMTPGTLVNDEERKLVLAYTVAATGPVRIWEWRSATMSWVERVSPGANVPASGLGKLVTAGPGKMAFWSESPTTVGEVTMWIWDAATASWTLTRSSTRPYLDFAFSPDDRASYPPAAAYVGQGRVLLAGPANWDRSFEPLLVGPQTPPPFLNLVTPTWEWTLP